MGRSMPLEWSSDKRRVAITESIFPKCTSTAQSFNSLVLENFLKMWHRWSMLISRIASIAKHLCSGTWMYIVHIYRKHSIFVWNMLQSIKLFISIVLIFKYITKENSLAWGNDYLKQTILVWISSRTLLFSSTFTVGYFYIKCRKIIIWNIIWFLSA